LVFGSAYNMEMPFSNAGFKPDTAFASAAERFFELLKTFGLPAGGQVPDWSTLAAPLAGQFEQWLRLSQSAGPWFAGAGAAAPAAPFAALPPWSFGPLPIGPAAPQAAEAQRIMELLGRLAQLQAQLAAHWNQIANTAVQRFIARLGSAGAAAPGVDQALRLYELWVSCAEEAYAAAVHQEDFSHLQAEIANVSAALLVEQRRHAETLVRAFGLPTRNEVDALYGQMKDLRRQFEALAPLPRAPATTARGGAGKSRATGAGRAAKANRSRRDPAAPAAGERRARTRGPRR
jgi:hypothetical protein